MATAREDAEARFPTDIAKHRMTVIRDDGLYRHLRFAQPGTRNMSFDILTWPGYLCFCGDMGDYLFMRLEDMLEFFRHDKINPSYWAEKVQAEDKDSGVKEYSQDKARAWVKDALEELDEESEIHGEACTINYDEGEDRLYQQLDSMSFDMTEVNWRDYTYRYIWCCLALVWAVKQYDARHQAAA